MLVEGGRRKKKAEVCRWKAVTANVSGAVATTPQEEASVWRHHFAKDFDHRIKTVPFENLANSLQEIRTQVQTCDTSEGTLVTPACNSMQEIRTDTRKDKTQQDEAACDPVAQVEPCCLDWVDELSQVAGTMRSDKEIGVVSIPP